MSPLSPLPDRRRRPIRHGTTGGYQRCRPSCDACRAAWAAYFERYRKEAKADKTARMTALEMLAAHHPGEFLNLYEKAQKGSQ